MKSSGTIREVRMCGQCAHYGQIDSISCCIFGGLCAAPDYSKDHYELACDMFVLKDEDALLSKPFDFMIPTIDELAAGVAYRPEDDLRLFWASECSCHPDNADGTEDFPGFIRRNGMIFKPNSTAPRAPTKDN